MGATTSLRSLRISERAASLILHLRSWAWLQTYIHRGRLRGAKLLSALPEEHTHLLHSPLHLLQTRSNPVLNVTEPGGFADGQAGLVGPGMIFLDADDHFDDARCVGERQAPAVVHPLERQRQDTVVQAKIGIGQELLQVLWNVVRKEILAGLKSSNVRRLPNKIS